MRSSGSMGLDLGTSAVRAAEVTVSSAGPRLDRFAQIGLPPGAIAGGTIREPKAVTAALKRLRAVGRFRTTRVAVGVANPRVLVQQVELPWMPSTELRAALRYQVQDVVPFPVAEAVIDYAPIEEFVGSGGSRMLRAWVVAADSAMVKDVVAVARAAGFRPEVVDLTPFALLRVATLAAPGAASGPDAASEAIIDVGAASTNVVIHTGGVPRFVRTLAAGGEDVTEYLAERLGIPRHEAEARKRGLATGPRARSGQPADAAAGPAVEAGADRAVEAAAEAAAEAAVQAAADPAGDPAGDPAAEVEADAEHDERQIRQAAVARLVAEICGTLDAYRNQPGGRPLHRLLLSGGGRLQAGLPEQLRATTRLPVQLTSPVTEAGDGARLSESVRQRADPFAAVPLGLALRMAAT